MGCEQAFTHCRVVGAPIHIFLAIIIRVDLLHHKEVGPLAWVGSWVKFGRLIVSNVLFARVIPYLRKETSDGVGLSQHLLVYEFGSSASVPTHRYNAEIQVSATPKNEQGYHLWLQAYDAGRLFAHKLTPVNI